MSNEPQKRRLMPLKGPGRRSEEVSVSGTVQVAVSKEASPQTACRPYPHSPTGDGKPGALKPADLLAPTSPCRLPVLTVTLWAPAPYPPEKFCL